MAIEKTVFTATAGANRLAEVRAWFAANSTDYFDTITDISNNTFYCKKDNKNVVMFETGVANGCALYLANGADQHIRINNTFNPEWIVKTSKGIMIKFQNTLANSFHNYITFAKSPDGDLVIVFLGTTYGATDYSEFFCYSFDRSANFGSYMKEAISADGQAAARKQLVTSAPMTALVPIPVNDIETYAVGVYRMAYYQFSSAGNITANGKNYFSNVYYVLEE